MGALPGGGLLTVSVGAWFDVERYRASPERLVVVRQADRPMVVLGSTQPDTVVDGDRARRDGVPIVRRRSGGGAVYLAPGDPVWADVWLPRGDPLWEDDVLVSGEWVGEWWRSSILAAGLTDPEVLTVHRGHLRPGPSPLFCFAGTGPGEVLADGRKVVGLAQWRCRQGALIQGCAYRRWDPRPLAELLALSEADRSTVVAAVSPVAVGLDDLPAPRRSGPPPGGDPDPGRRLVGELLAHLPAGPPWQVTTPW